MSYETPAIESVYFPEFFKTLPSMKGKRVAITGCTSGTGFITALNIAKLGGEVVMMNRASERATAAEEKIKAEVEGAVVSTVECDLMSFASVKAAKALFDAKFADGVLDVLVLNAGIMAMPDRATDDGYDVQMQVNHLSQYLLVHLLMPTIQATAEKAGEARIVFASSNARTNPHSGDNPLGLQAKYFGKNGGDLGGDGGKWNRYGQTKLANCVFAFALHDKLQAEGSKIKVLITHPGLAATSLQATTSTESSVDLTNLMKGSQSAEDGTMPMLLGVCSPDAQSGDFFAPKDAGVIGPGTKGEAVKIPPEEYLGRAEYKAMLMEESAKAVAEFLA